MDTLRIAITGANGMIGGHLSRHYQAAGNELTLFCRSPLARADKMKQSIWNPDRNEITAADLENHDLVIHLAGRNISGSRWTNRFKKEIFESRVRSTRLISETLAKLKNPPSLFLCASAVGYYGNRQPDENIDENAPLGNGFMAEVCQGWEGATEPASSAGIRVINMRFGVVLSRNGGALTKMLPIFKIGLGGKMGSGKQMMSWVALDEIPSIINHLVANSQISGAVNFVSPNPVSNAEFTASLAKVLNRPALFTVPSMAAKLAFGEMAEELLLSGAKVIPRKLVDSNYSFVFANLEAALKSILKS